MVLKIVVFNLVEQKKHHDETNFDSIFANRILNIVPIVCMLWFSAFTNKVQSQK